MSASSRTLIWVPVIHTQADLGSMHDLVRKRYVREVGHRKWQKHMDAVDDLWERIRTALTNLQLDYARVRLYQDGLPICGYEAEIVRETARSGSRNHAILQELMEKGAHLTGTESPELLLEEYNLACQTLLESSARLTGELARRQRELSETMLEKRDRFIAERIDQTLKAGETGLIFLGLLHSLDGRLPADMAVTRLDPAAAVVLPQSASDRAPPRNAHR